MSQSPVQPKRDYSSERKFGRIGGSLFKVGRSLGRATLMVGGSLLQGGPSLEERMRKAGHEKLYRHYGVKRWSRPGEEVAKLLGLSKASEWEKKTIQQEALNLDQKAEPANLKGIVEQEAVNEIKELQKDPKIAKMWIDKLERTLFAGGRFSGGKHVSSSETDKVITGISGIPREVKNLLAARFKGLEKYQETVENKGTTQAEFAGRLKELQSKGVLRERDVAAADKSLGAVKLPSDPQTASKETSAPQRTGWKISAFTGWGKKTNDNT